MAGPSRRRVLKRIDGLAFSPDGRLASSAEDKTIRLWNPDSGQPLLILKGHAARIRWIEFSSDRHTLVSASYDRTVKLWEATPSAELGTPGDVPVAASPDGTPALKPDGAAADRR